MTSPLAAYEPRPEHPFGSRNPDAPAETNQYEFMIGEWRCDERNRQPDGSWTEFESLVRSHFFLNGFGIINQTFLADDASAMTYQFDPASGSWVITNMKAPGFSRTEWTGHKVADGMVASRDTTNPGGAPITLSIKFLNIKPSSFNWQLEVTSPAGAVLIREKSCKRVGKLQ